MTYGPPNQGGYNPAGQQPGTGYPAPAASGGIVAKLTGQSSTNGNNLFIVGIVAAVLGLLMVIFSCLTWLTVTQSVEFGEGSEKFSIASEATVSGLGSAKGGDPELSGPGAEEIRQYIDANSEEFESDATDVDTSKAGVWTLVFGVLAILAAAPLITRRFQGFGAIGVTAFGLAATIASIVFVASKGSGVVDSKEIKDLEKEGAEIVEQGFANSADVTAGTGYGLWIVLIASILLLLAAIYAFTLVATGKPTVAGAAVGYAGSVPNAPLYGQSSPQQGHYPQAGGQQPVQYGQTQLNSNSGPGGAPLGGAEPSQPNQYGQTQYNQYPGQGGTPQ